MQVTTNGPTRTVTIVFNVDEWNVVLWASTKFGAATLKNRLAHWFIQWWRQKEDERLTNLGIIMPPTIGDDT